MWESLFQEALIVTVLASTLRGCTPMLLAALGETYGESSGILNLGIEGMMVAGAFSSFWAGLQTDMVPFGFFAAAITGAGLGLITGVLVVSLGLNQIVVGLGMTIFVTSLCNLLHRVVFGNQFPMLWGAGLTCPVPILSEISVIGPALFNQHWLVYITLALVPLLYFILYRTRLGLRIRAVGREPRAADASGVNVFLIRYLAIILAGVLASTGGAFLAIGDLAFFVPGMIQGRGYIAIVIVMLGQWNPVKVFLGSLLFGFAMSLTSALQVVGVKINPDFILTMPYLVVIVTLIVIAKSTSLPSALCIPYRREM
ncbi:MAG: ABC transporter permease [Deltaproteobacteria bacterium]|nr:ABC transporter permease [Deltaproteobacteria bacterium]MBW1995260.1 ABC transporter permease [Deltaproteobacteria bacterium]MBW2151267.1 ABC transporter permease [Deltaproteobacteria bacterium]